ncbi:hypothetical protein ALC53_10916, partial [Atta colombica]
FRYFGKLKEFLSDALEFTSNEFKTLCDQLHAKHTLTSVQKQIDNLHIQHENKLEKTHRNIHDVNEMNSKRVIPILLLLIPERDLNEANIQIDEALLNLDDKLQKLYVLSSKELTFSGSIKHIDNFPVPIDEIYYTTLSIALIQKQLFIQSLIPLIEDKNLELTRVISFPRTIGNTIS